MPVPKVCPDVLLAHMSKVKIVKELVEKTQDALVKELAASWLEVLGSKAGNDILESVLVRATGREPKDASQKHGADSKDGLVEAKPCKGAYTAHISDDSAMCLLKSQKIPYCVLGVSSKDGREINWVAIVPYRIFDDSRYRKICSKLGLPENDWPKILPTNEAARNEILEKLVSMHKPDMYVRSSALPFECLNDLPASEYSVWISDDLLKETKPTQREKQLIKMWKAQQSPA